MRRRRRSTAVTRHRDVQGVDLVFEGITVTLARRACSGTVCREGKVLVSELSSVASYGKVTALMGPSGAGKTTLLNALSGMLTYGTTDTRHGAGVGAGWLS